MSQQALLPYTAETARETAPLYEKVSSVIPEVEWPVHAPYIAEINRLKKEKNAVILAHNYQTPEIYHCVADIVGDSLALAYRAKDSDADIIIMAGVYFMAETAKLVNPDKTILIPDERAGCSLADSITAADVRLLRGKYPGVPIVCYVNTSAEVKAEVDICCTSSNAVDIVNSLNAERVIFLPDQYLADWVNKNTEVDIISWQGKCEVHERFTAKEIRAYRKMHKDIIILAHPECPPDVLAEADFVGSTSGMSNYVTEKQPSRVVMITECSMSDNVAIENPKISFIRPCNLCPHMKTITLPKILQTLQNGHYEVVIAPEVAARARLSVERMLDMGVKRA